MPSHPKVETTLIKNRRFMGDTTFVYQGQTHESILFEVRELFERDDQEEGYFEQEFSGIEIYAKDIGLVYYRKEITSELIIEYQLVDQYPMTELEEKFENLLEEK